MEHLTDSSFIKNFEKLYCMQQNDGCLASAWKANHYTALMDWKP